MNYITANFGVDSSSRFSYRARTQTQVTDVAYHPNHGSATAGVGG